MSISYPLMCHEPIFFPLLAAQGDSEGAQESALPLVLFLVGLPAAVMCWWLALKVAEEPVQADFPTIWDDQPVRWLESTVRFARYLESQGKPIDMGLVLSDDVRAAAHRLIDQTDEHMVRAFLAAWLAASAAKNPRSLAPPS